MKSQNSFSLIYLVGLVAGHHGKTLDEAEIAYESESLMVATLPSDAGWAGVIERYNEVDPFRREMMLLALLALTDPKEIRSRLGNNLSPLTDPP